MLHDSISPSQIVKDDPFLTFEAQSFVAQIMLPSQNWPGMYYDSRKGDTVEIARLLFERNARGTGL